MLTFPPSSLGRLGPARRLVGGRVPHSRASRAATLDKTFLAQLLFYYYFFFIKIFLLLLLLLLLYKPSIVVRM